MTPIENYALIGDMRTAALVGLDGSIDWLCLPRFDSPACLAALVGSEENGRWRLAPEGSFKSRRRYVEDTLVLQTVFETKGGAVEITDCMLLESGSPNLVRLVAGLRGTVSMRSSMNLRFDYGSIVPWIRHREREAVAIAGPDTIHLRSNMALSGDNASVICRFEISKGQRAHFVLNWHSSHKAAPPPVKNPLQAVRWTERWWRRWSAKSTYDGRWPEAVSRSLITLKALTHAPSGGIVAAPTTSLPEKIGGVRNWDYRYCWLRDATFTLYALMIAGYTEEAKAWRLWLLRAVAGKPPDMQIMYGVTGERRLTESTLDWLAGYEWSRPVRTGNAASRQVQLDVFGEVMDALHVARRGKLEPYEASWRLQSELLEYVESIWRKPDDGIWEVRGGRRQFTHSKVMAWVAMDRGVRAIEQFGLAGPVERWRAVRDAIHADVCRKGFSAKANTFVQSYGSDRLDASLLMMPLVGFLPASDPRMKSTIEAIERELMVDGFVRRYHPRGSGAVDGLPAGEGTFLACSFWLADNLALLGRVADARKLFEKLLKIRNDVGLLAEQYDPRARRLLGNFPQALSHVSLINTARNLSRGGGPAHRRKS